MKTKEQKDEMVAKIAAQKETLPEFSGFGGENWAIADGQIRVINGNMHENDVTKEFGEEFDEYDNQNETVREILIAVFWLEGGADDSELVDD